MEQLSIVKTELLDQYMKYKDSIEIYQHKIDTCTKGYITTKRIKGKSYPYLQWRNKGRICSKYIDPDKVALFQEDIVIRKQYEANLKEIKKAIKEIESFLGKKNIEQYIREKNE